MVVTNRVKYITMFCSMFLIVTGIIQILQEHVQFKIVGLALSLSGIIMLMTFLPEKK